MTVKLRVATNESPPSDTLRVPSIGPRRLGMLTCLALLLGSGLLCEGNAHGSPVADIYFGRGVQAFFDERWGRAEAYFDRAVQYAPGEPRAYYFRGLARQRLEHPLEAENDLRRGALIEARKGRVYALGGALQSLVGEDRTLLDKIRVEMLSGLPAYQDGAGLPKGSDRNRRALRSEFRMPLALLTEIDSAEQLSALVEQKRPAWASRSRLSPAAMLTEKLPEPSVAPTAEQGEQAVSELAESGMADAATEDAGDATAEDDPFAAAEDQGDPFADDPDPFGDDPGQADPFGGGAPTDEAPADQSPADEPMDADPFGDDPFGDDADPFG